MKKILLFTFSRADFGYLNPLIYNLKKNKKFKLELVVSGTHLDKEFGKVDIKAPKRQYRNGPIDYSIHWWEFKNVTGKPGWGTPNNVKRFIAFRIKEGFVLVDPQKVNSILEDKCTSHYRGLWGLNTRKDRKDLAAMIPVDFLLEHCEHRIEV